MKHPGDMGGTGTSHLMVTVLACYLCTTHVPVEMELSVIWVYICQKFLAYSNFYDNFFYPKMSMWNIRMCQCVDGNVNLNKNNIISKCAVKAHLQEELSIWGRMIRSKRKAYLMTPMRQIRTLVSLLSACGRVVNYTRSLLSEIVHTLCSEANNYTN
jgi:hypothetical protein